MSGHYAYTFPEMSLQHASLSWQLLCVLVDGHSIEQEEGYETYSLDLTSVKNTWHLRWCPWIMQQLDNGKENIRFQSSSVLQMVQLPAHHKLLEFSKGFDLPLKSLVAPVIVFYGHLGSYNFSIPSRIDQTIEQQ